MLLARRLWLKDQNPAMYTKYRGPPTLSARCCPILKQGTRQSKNLLYTILLTSRNLQHYFQEHNISVITDFPLGEILHNRDAEGRISKWAVELRALSLEFKSRTAIKSQALVDFMTEWWENQVPTPPECPEHWVMYFDGSLKLEGADAGLLLISPQGEKLKYILQIFWKYAS